MNGSEPKVTSEPVERLLASLTLDEKVALVSGHGLWRTAPITRLGIPAIIMTDGTYGVRYSIEQIDGGEGNQLEQFFAVVNQRENEVGGSEFGTSKPATCFPNGSSLGCSWDEDLSYELGAALAQECQSLGVQLLLGPGINIRRTPLAGRAYEYYSEDPYLAADIAASVIRGLQDNGVGASLKHFACNNSEVERTTMDSVVDDRALREIYLKGFERAIAKSDPWTVMSSYNRLNGVQAAENGWLLNDLLRGEWGYQGCVLSDWHGIKDRPASLRAGNDLDMPESKLRKRLLREAVERGEVPMEDLDRSAARVLELVDRAMAGARKDVAMDAAGHHALARRMASQSIVLLKNRDACLPLNASIGRRVLVLGPTATIPVIQGSGCATTRPTQVDAPIERLRALADSAFEFIELEGPFDPSDEKHRARAVEAARTADYVLVFGNTDVAHDGEGSDRTTLDLAKGQDLLIADVAVANSRTIAVITSPDAVVMPWIDDVAAVCIGFFAGQGFGHAIAQVLLGQENPSGKLTATLPRKMVDIPAWHTYPGENGEHRYAEGIFAGYRWYDQKQVDPLFPFGFGLSYTTFRYDNLALSRTAIGDDDMIEVTVDVTNTGSCFGREIVQLYAAWQGNAVKRPPRELKAFRKVALQPGETATVTMSVHARDLAYWDTLAKDWLLERGSVRFEAGASSRDIRLTADCDIEPTRLHRPSLSIDSLASEVLTFPNARPKLMDYLTSAIGLGEEQADVMLAGSAQSFLGFYNTLCWFVEDKVDAEELAAVIRSIEDEAR